MFIKLRYIVLFEEFNFNIYKFVGFYYLFDFDYKEF